MFICKEVLTKDEVKTLIDKLNKVEWSQGKTNLDINHKNNFEYVDSDLSTFIGTKIQDHPIIQKYTFISKLMLPRFNKYEAEGKYNLHVDSFLQNELRTDWSMTLFLSEPESYEGGELVLHDVLDRPVKYKLNAGDMLVYPSGHLHEVAPVTKGTRIAAISWAQSMIKNQEHIKIFKNLIDVMTSQPQHSENLTRLSVVYNNLLREWSDLS